MRVMLSLLKITMPFALLPSAQAVEVPVQGAARFIDREIHSSNFLTSRSSQVETFGLNRNAPDLSPGSFFVFDRDQNATLARGSGRVSTVRCDLLGQSFLWKNEVTAFNKNYWDEKNEIAVKSLSLNFQWHSDAHLAIDFKNGTCKSFESFDADTFFSFQTNGVSPKFIYYRDYGYSQKLGSQLISYDPVTQTKTILADCKDLGAGGVCKDFRKFSRLLAWPATIGVTANNRIVLQTAKGVLLVDPNLDSLSIKLLYSIKDGDKTKIRAGSVISNGWVYLLTDQAIRDSAPTYIGNFGALRISLQSSKVEALSHAEASGAMLSSDGLHLLTWNKLKIPGDPSFANFEDVKRVELASGKAMALPAMGAYRFPSETAQYTGTVSFWTGDLMSYRMANNSYNRQWLEFREDGSLHAWDDSGGLAVHALDPNNKRTLGVRYNVTDQTLTLMAGSIFSSEAPVSLAIIPPSSPCENAQDCGPWASFYYWPESKTLVYYNTATKKVESTSIQLGSVLKGPLGSP